MPVAVPYLVAGLAGAVLGYRLSGGLNTLTTMAAAGAAAYVTYRVVS